MALPVPRDLLLVTTYRCNSRCVMCNIWQARPDPRTEITPDDVTKLPSTFTDVNVSGGEVFLREDIVEIVSAMKKTAPRAKIVISTNGLNPDTIERRLPGLRAADPDLGFAISIDGTRAHHDRVRGFEGAHAKSMETVRMLLRNGVRNVRLAFTAVDQNTTTLAEVYREARSLGIEFTCAVAHNSDHYFQTQANRAVNADVLAEQLNDVAREELASLQWKSWFRAYFYHGLAAYARSEHRLLPCEAAHLSLMVDPIGDVYACNIMDWKFGNLKRQTFDEIWTSERAEEVRRMVRECEKHCWMVCTVRSSIKKNPAVAVEWILRNKVKSHLGRNVIEAGSPPAGPRLPVEPLPEAKR
jgi:MoaA/NifB/PqqE/SkfB family radical SAM enzyme